MQEVVKQADVVILSVPSSFAMDVVDHQYLYQDKFVDVRHLRQSKDGN